MNRELNNENNNFFPFQINYSNESNDESVHNDIKKKQLVNMI